MKLTVDYLKQESCNFDLECIFVLDLSKKGIKRVLNILFFIVFYFDFCFSKDIKELDRLSECVNLEILNLSNNQIFDLTRLRSLEKLQYLNLSCNNVINLGTFVFEFCIKEFELT